MNNVWAIRKRLDMTQDEFAEYCNVSRISIARYETGGKVSRENAEKIAAACDTSIAYVLGVTETHADYDVDIIRERLRRDPVYRTLFDAASKATPEHLKAAAAMLKALEGNTNG